MLRMAAEKEAKDAGRKGPKGAENGWLRRQPKAMDPSLPKAKSIHSKRSIFGGDLLIQHH